MKAKRTTISGTAVAGVALAAALVLASAPAASPRTAARPQLTGAAARTVPPSRTEAAKDVWPGAFRTDGTSARELGIKATRPTTARGDAVRVVVESRNAALARRSVIAAGGRVERGSNDLVQALVARSAVAGLSERPGVDRVRAPYSRI